VRILPTDNSYRTFCELISGYRIFCVMDEALNSGLIDRLDDGAATAAELLAATGLLSAEGGRFIALLVSIGLLEEYAGQLQLSGFSRAYLTRSSATSQRHVLEFEPLLQNNWRQLGTVLREGQGTLIREQSPDECRQKLQLFQQAMTEAALVRSRELWDEFSNLAESGLIIDIGAGDGTYLREFLQRHPHWQGVACDLADVCAQVAPDSIPHNLSLHPCNILGSQELAALVTAYRGTADILLFSNFCHCYSPVENEAIFGQAGQLLATDGLLIVHDFFRDANSYGALYDLHMLVNTWNGRSYTVDETAAQLESAGFGHQRVIELPSSSLAIVASRHSP